MNDIIAKVTPLTKGIIWLPKEDDLYPAGPVYKALDYLLDGLLTAGQPAPGKSRVIISQSFNQPLYVFIVKELIREEYDSFLQLLKKDLTEANNILVIDEAEAFPGLQKMTPSEIRSQLQQLH